MYNRWYAAELKASLERPFVHLVFGARQTGKTTLLNAVLPPETVRVDFADPAERSRHLADSGLFLKLCRQMPADRKGQFVFVDEAQAVPSVFDAVQHLYDNDKGRWRFVLCGSSARKLRKTGTNLLPGRSFFHRLYPLMMAEHPRYRSAFPTRSRRCRCPGRPTRLPPAFFHPAIWRRGWRMGSCQVSWPARKLTGHGC